MTKLKTPLLSFRAQGNLGPDLAFSQRVTGSVAIKLPVPTGPATRLQLSRRWFYSQAARLWPFQTAADKLIWHRTGAPLHQTAYAYFLGLQLADYPTWAGIWPMDGSGEKNLADRSLALADLVLYGPTRGPGEVGNALVFDGVDDYALVTPFAHLLPPGAFTLAFWFNWAAARPNGYAVWGSPRGFDVFFSASALKPRLEMQTTGGYKELPITPTVAAGAWRSLAFTYDPDAGANNLRAYLDGQPQGLATHTGTITGLGTYFAIGSDVGLAYRFKGSLDILRLVHRAMNPAEILALYNSDLYWIGRYQAP